MKLPANLRLKESAHGHGDKGSAFYTYCDTAGFGVVRQDRRESSRESFRTSWRFRWLPDKVFQSAADMTAAIEALPDEQAEAERAKWPVLGAVKDISGNDWPNSCWRHRDRKGVVQASAATCWIGGEGVICSLCAECAQDLTAASVVAVVEERRRRVAERRAPPQHATGPQR